MARNGEPSKAGLVVAGRPRWVWLGLYAWVSPTTAVGLLAGALTMATGGGVQRRRGTLEFHGGFSRWLGGAVGFGAMTLGHAIIGRDRDCLDFCRDHEQVHVRQAERWGPLFIPAYLAAGAWSWWRTGSAYYQNPFEKEAYDDDRRRRPLA